jgi:hypothetical protein
MEDVSQAAIRLVGVWKVLALLCGCGRRDLDSPGGGWRSAMACFAVNHNRQIDKLGA